VKGAVALQRGSPGAAYELLVSAAHDVAREDPARALELQAQAMTGAFIAGWSPRAFAEAHEFLSDLPPTGAPYEPLVRASMGAMVTPSAATKEAARDKLLEAVTVGAAAEDFRFIDWAAIASGHVGDLRGASELVTRMVVSARAAGSFNTLPVALLASARLGVSLRALDEAEECAREGIELTRQLAQQNFETCFLALLVRCLAARGRVEECRELGDSTLGRALAHGVAIAADDVRIAFAELELSLAHGAAARDMIEQLSVPLYRLRAVPYRVEASLLSGDSETGGPSLDAFVEYAEHARDPVLLGWAARSSALLAPSPELAESLFLEALRYQTGHQQQFEHARTALAYGQFLRRAQRRTQARVQLRDALATFEGLNVPLWAERARAELAASGITARKRDPSTLDTLTPQELRIAKLVATGATNRDVAGQLFVSPKTVEYHLRNVFLKVGVSSRVELARLPLGL
jgi:DNA-binding CsgD family transcriptional regulator